jgi:hypothetical protein
MQSYILMPIKAAMHSRSFCWVMRREHRHFVLCLALVASPVPAADYALGLTAYHRGDIAVAHREFSALAEQGDPAAQFSLAMLYLKGNQPDYARAIPWLQKSAGSGLPDSQYMLGMLSLYGVGMAKDTERGMLLLGQASDQGNEHAQALLGQLETARIREAESQRHKAQQARNLRAELDKAKASEQELQKRLARSRKREKSLASERASLNQARVSDSAAKDKMRREQARLEGELESLRLQLAEAERVREAQQAAKDEVIVAEMAEAESVVEDAPGEAVVAGKVVEILPGGVLLTGVSRRAQGRSEAFPEGFVVFLNLSVTDGLSEGQEVAYAAEPATPYRYKYESGATGRIRAYRAIE